MKKRSFKDESFLVRESKPKYKRKHGEIQRLEPVKPDWDENEKHSHATGAKPKDYLDGTHFHKTRGR